VRFESSFFDGWTADNERTGPDQDKPAKPRRRWMRGVLGVAAIGAATVGVLAPGQSANADPSPQVWYQLRMCESSNNYSINTGNDHYGAYQFDLATWRGVGGTGYPNTASKAEQDARALILYRERGWQPWQCASILGLHEDRDARSGRTSDIKIAKPTRTLPPATPGKPSSTIPAFPGARWYHYGDNNANIKTFQNEMHRRGYFPAGTGQYGPLTQRMVKRLQQLNGLVPNGYIGPNTWRLAWTGKYAELTPARATATIPAFPGSRWYQYGDNNTNIKTFQNEMHRRGYFPAGTGQYGPQTAKMVKQLQRLNGLVPNGYIGPNTWRLAWTGKYTKPA
jgi:peptidoglycan hydrolase-like protein with peptidoglycan-binding domain